MFKHRIKYKNLFSQIVKNNSGKIKLEGDKYIYIMGDKYSVSPEKEIKIRKELKGDKAIYTKEINNFQNKNYNNFKDFILVKKYLARVFLPREYPNSVREGYYHFSKYSFFAGTTFHIMNFLTSQALINSLELTRSMSLCLSASMNWVIKDGIGQIGSFFFSGKFSNSIERDLKKWRIISLFMFNISILLEISTLWKPQYFLLLASLATLLKLSALVANTSTRAGIYNHFGKQNNITDLTNKYFVQNNLSFLIGTTISLGLSFYLPITFNPLFPVICFLSVIHLNFAYKSTVNITLRDFNAQRAYYFAKQFISTNSIPDYITINKKETFLFNKLNFLNFCNYDIEKIFATGNTEFLDKIIVTFTDCNFMTYVEKNYSYFSNNYYFKIYTFLKMDADNLDIFMAFLYSVRLNDLNSQRKFNKKDKHLIEDFLIENMKSNLEWLEKINKKEFLHFLKEKHWDTSFGLLEEKYKRYHLVFK